MWFFTIYNTKIVYSNQEEEQKTSKNCKYTWAVNENASYFRVELWKKKHKLL